MSYGVVTTDDNQPTPHVDTENGNSVSLDWSNFNTRLAQLRAEKGENSDEVQAFTKAAHDSLTAYYNSPAYREWYENYCKHQAETAKQAPAAVTQSTVIQPRKPRHDLKPSERMRSALVDDGEDPEVALARAEAEQQAGVPLSVDTEAPKGESATEHTPAESATTESAATASTKRKTTTPAPAWYEMSEDKNTHVYVTGLPVDITESDFFELMSKYGVIMNEPFTDRPRIKLYLDEEGKPKGDGRCCYVKNCGFSGLSINAPLRSQTQYNSHRPTPGKTECPHGPGSLVNPEGRRNGKGVRHVLRLLQIDSSDRSSEASKCKVSLQDFLYFCVPLELRDRDIEFVSRFTCTDSCANHYYAVTDAANASIS
ncbi:hypothetical protein CSKR_104104 [Clonorchis sinensis]|uniref:Uncharacterized protein n=1 Tax=Clonorchis sinensis TaxID=79923 RepID=A0A3R7GR53_CLOSI|nr:hypothetical protein CSKR_104104 [Clonorchis sinensis]